MRGIFEASNIPRQHASSSRKLSLVLLTMNVVSAQSNSTLSPLRRCLRAAQLTPMYCLLTRDSPSRRGFPVLLSASPCRVTRGATALLLLLGVSLHGSSASLPSRLKVAQRRPVRYVPAHSHTSTRLQRTLVAVIGPTFTFHPPLYTISARDLPTTTLHASSPRPFRHYLSDVLTPDALDALSIYFPHHPYDHRPPPSGEYQPSSADALISSRLYHAPNPSPEPRTT
nr:hypothetical protein Iba_chr04dCG11920 [Ipomoea batatas]